MKYLKYFESLNKKSSLGDRYDQIFQEGKYFLFLNIIDLNCDREFYKINITSLIDDINKFPEDDENYTIHCEDTQSLIYDYISFMIRNKNFKFDYVYSLIEGVNDNNHNGIIFIGDRKDLQNIMDLYGKENGIEEVCNREMKDGREEEGLIDISEYNIISYTMLETYDQIKSLSSENYVFNGKIR